MNFAFSDRINPAFSGTGKMNRILHNKKNPDNPACQGEAFSEAW
jgi:hypothetical protein